MGLMAPDWFTMFSDLIRAVNNSRFTASGTAYSLTGTTDETTAATIPVTVGNSGLFRLNLGLSCTSNANTKTVRVKAGTTTLTTITLDNNTASQFATVLVVGRGASSQYVMAYGDNVAGASGATTADLSGNTTLTVTLQLGTNTDTIALESWALEVEQA